MNKNKTQSYLTNAIIDSIVRKIDYWLNQLNDNQDDPLSFYETDHFIWDITDPLTVAGLTINHPDQIVKIWWTSDTDVHTAEFYTNLDFSAEDNLTFYIELEQLITEDLKVLEESLIDQIKISFRNSNESADNSL